MLVIQSFLDRFKESTEEGHKWLKNQHPVDITLDVLSSKLEAHHQILDDVFLINHNGTSNYHTKVSDECVGLILDREHSVVSRSLNRIHIDGRQSAPAMDWTRVFIEPEYDGKLVTFYYYKGTWYMQTMGSVQGGELADLPDRSVSYRTCVLDYLRDNKIASDFNDLFKTVSKQACFVCIYTHPQLHICGPHGKEELLLLTVMDKIPGRLHSMDQMFPAYVDELADMLGLNRPSSLQTNSRAAAINCAEHLPAWRKGIIVQDSNYTRVKIQNPKFKPITRLLRAGDKFTKNQLIRMFLTGAGDEVAKLEGRYNEPLKLFNRMVDIRFKTTKELFDKNKDSTSQKEFAEAVNHSLLNYIIFHVRKNGPIDRPTFINMIKPDAVEGFIKNIGELDAFKRSIEKAMG